jgi:hypothetical protein
MQSSDRLLKLQRLIKEAEQLAKDEAHLQHNDRRLTRLSATLWVCRDVADEVVEQQVYHRDPPESKGRPDREHW